LPVPFIHDMKCNGTRKTPFSVSVPNVSDPLYGDPVQLTCTIYGY